MTRPTIRQRNQAIRNLRSGPAFLTPARVAGMIDWLSAVNVARAPVPVPPAAIPAAVEPAKVKLPRKPKPKPLVIPAATVSVSRAVFRFARPAVSLPAAPPIAIEPAQVAIAPIPAAPVAPVRSARPNVRIIGVQNGSSAIHWLRTHGVSVRAASTDVFGTRYLVSNEFGEMDVAAVVAIARRKGFEG